MITKRPPTRHARTKSGNEWLSILKDLEFLLAQQNAPDSIIVTSPAVDKTALAAIHAAYTTTLRHYISLLDDPTPNPRVQKQISRLWQKAGTALRHSDPALANRLRAGNPFWTSPNTWRKETIRRAWTLLNSIRAYANRTDPEVQASLRWGHTLST